MKTLNLLASVVLFASSSAFASGPAPAEPITIQTLKANGSGCRAGTYSTNISDDKQAFTLSFSELIAAIGPGIPVTSNRKNCNLTLNLHVPQGWQYSIASFNFRGFLQADRGIEAEQSATYFLEGNADQFKFSSVKYGPKDEDYVYTDNIGIQSVVWSPCGIKRALNVNTAVRLRNLNKSRYPNAEGLLTNDTIDGQIRQVWGFGLNWRRC